MAEKHSFSVSKSGSKVAFAPTWDRPESLGDVAWEAKVAGPHEERVTVEMSAKVADAVNVLARKDLVIAMQTVGRPHMAGGLPAVQKAINAFRYGVRAASASKVKTIDATDAKLTREQIDLLTAQGATIVNIPAKLAGK